MCRTAVFLQVRLASTRLPEKALLPLEGKAAIVHAMEALALLPADEYLLVTDEESVARLAPPAAKCGYGVFAGDRDNVLKRFCDAAERYSVNRIIRATGDNPLVSAAAAREALRLQETSGADYAGITDTPYGTGVEVVLARALADVLSGGPDRYEREHVTPGVYRRPERYKVVVQQTPARTRFPEMRVTLDTPDDYDYIAGIFRALYRGRPIELPELVAYGHQQQRSSA
ncbi:MAG: NTP transferase domain-containing protein [Spirochaetales bacterium]|nr:NTP transferase domain-containing protein [Spirochaetales bacterium]